MNQLATLLAAVHAEPDNIDARMVYADALTDAGDPRGEFIALQCRRADSTTRERELLAEHGTSWLGRLAPILDPAWTVFDNGFLSVARVNKVPRPKLLATAGDPTWSTVTQLTFHKDVGGVVVKNGPVVRGPRVPAAVILLHPIMRALREVRGIDGDVLVTLCREGAKLPIRSISASTYPLLERDGSDTWQMEASARAMLEVATGLPYLARLELHGYPCATPDLMWLVRSPLAGQLAYLKLANFGGPVDRWAEHARAAHRDLGELVIDYWGISRFTRTVDGSLGAIEINAVHLSPHQRQEIDAAIARLPAGAFDVRIRT